MDQIVNHPDDALLRSVNCANRTLVDKLLSLSTIQDGSSRIPLGFHCLLACGFSISDHGARPSLQLMLERYMKNNIAVGEVSSVNVFAPDTQIAYSWDAVVAEHYELDSGAAVAVGVFMDHCWDSNEACKRASVAGTAGEADDRHRCLSQTFVLPSFQCVFLPEPNPEVELDRWTAWFELITALQECLI